MKQIISTTIIADLILCLTFGIYGAIIENSVEVFVYAMFVGFGFVLLPIFIAVVLFNLLKPRLQFNSTLKEILFQIMTLSIIAQIGLIVWSIVEVFTDNLSFSSLTFTNILDQYKKEFLREIPSALAIAAIVPLVDRITTRFLKSTNK